MAPTSAVPIRKNEEPTHATDVICCVIARETPCAGLLRAAHCGATLNRKLPGNHVLRGSLMTDIYDKASRSAAMSRIRSGNTTPELRVRSALHRLGYRFRLHRKDLPGKPDIVLPRWSTVVFVHGCFWHSHTCCEGHEPKSNTEYWRAKLARNRERDKRNIDSLRLSGWNCIIIWECQTYSIAKIQRLFSEAMEPGLQKVKEGVISDASTQK
jgi:DNA mismatch endonuclease (patch repair protein)